MDVIIDAEFKSKIRPLSPDEFIGLEADIISAGRAIVPLILWNHVLIDGHNRHDICTRHGLPFETRDVGETGWTRNDALIWIVRCQLNRRNLDVLTRIEYNLELEGLIKAKADENHRIALVESNKARARVAPGCQMFDNLDGAPHNDNAGVAARTPIVSTPVRTLAEVGKAAGVSHETVRKASKVLADAPAEVAEKIRRGESTINKEYKAIVDAERKAEQVEAVKHAALPKGKYNIIVADPPWSYGARAEDVTHRAANPYPSMGIDAICAMPVKDIAADNSILWLWTTNAHMHEAYSVANAWGFTVKTILTWAKDRMGTGDWLRGQTEHCLMCIRGKPVVTLTNQTTLLHGPMREHSRKPDEFYAMVEALCPAPEGGRIEMFCRQARPGWIAAGAELGKFEAAA